MKVDDLLKKYNVSQKMIFYSKIKMEDEYIIKYIQKLLDELFNDIQKYITFTIEAETLNKNHFNNYLKRTKIKKIYNKYKIIIDDEEWYNIVFYCSLVEYLTENTKSKILLFFCKKNKNTTFNSGFIFKQCQDIFDGKNQHISINRNYFRKQKLKKLYES